MAKPGRQPQHNQRSMKRLLETCGWTETTGGKHAVKMTKTGHRPITLPHHGGGDYSRNLTRRILRQAGLKGDAIKMSEEAYIVRIHHEPGQEYPVLGRGCGAAGSFRFRPRHG